MPSSLAAHWTLAKDEVFLNHGSFDACPRPVLERQAELRARMERQPVRFLARELEGELSKAREALAALVGARAEDLVFVPNATTAVSTVLAAAKLAAGDEVLLTDHAYNACRNAVVRWAERRGATVTVAKVPFPISGPDEVVDAVLAAITPRTRLALIDHVTSPTALVWPVKALVEALSQRRVDVLVDGAHAPGMVPLELEALGAAYYTGNCHKWLCAPKGAAFLHVRRDRQAELTPLVTSHGLNSQRTDVSRFRLEHDWVGTSDPTAYLCIPAAIAFLSSLFPGGLAALQAHNHAAVIAARRVLCEALHVTPPCPDSMLGTMATIPLPAFDGVLQPPLFLDPLQGQLERVDRIEVPIVFWPKPPRRWVRISHQAYNAPEEYAALAGALQRGLGARAPTQDLL